MNRWFAWNVVFRLHERLKRHSTFAILREMEKADRLSGPDLEQLQSEKLREFIAYCHAHVPYIREMMETAGVPPAEIRKAEDLAKLPLMTKKIVRQHRPRLHSDIARSLGSFTTGGSTGEPLIFDISKRRTASRVACRERVSNWWGVGVGDPELAIWGSPVELTRQDSIRRLRDMLLSSRLLPAFEMSEATVSRYLDILERHGCAQLFGYPSSIYTLCLTAQKQGRSLRRVGVKVVFVTSEVLLPHQRALISETFGCPVANQYGGRDSGFLAHECPQGGMHIMSDAVVLEVVDQRGCPAAPGELGEIVATDLYSQEAPFLRYVTGDIGALSIRRCTCGRALPLLERLDGRANDSIVARDGRIINPLALVYPLREIPGVHQFRIRQKQVDCFQVQIIRDDQFGPAGEDKIRKGWTQLLGGPLEVTFEYVKDLPIERSGKLKHIVSEVLPAHAPDFSADVQPPRSVVTH
jgi:phenylacetate-CoA ligase